MWKFRKSSKSLFTIMCALMVTACNSSTKPSPTPIDIPANLAQECATLTPLPGVTGAEVLPWTLNLVHLYNDCRRRHRALADAWPK